MTRILVMWDIQSGYPPRKYQCDAHAQVIRGGLDATSKNDLGGITLRIRPICWVHPLTSHLLLDRDRDRGR